MERECERASVRPRIIKMKEKDMRVESSVVECTLVLGYWINFNFIAMGFNSNLFTVPLGGLPNCHRLQRFSLVEQH